MQRYRGRTLRGSPGSCASVGDKCGGKDYLVGMKYIVSTVLSKVGARESHHPRWLAVRTE